MGLDFIPDIDGALKAGTKVNAGTYICYECPHDADNDKAVVVFDKPSRLPQCPVCDGFYWMKI